MNKNLSNLSINSVEDVERALDAVRRSVYFFRLLPEAFQKNHEIALLAIQGNLSNFSLLSDDLKNDLLFITNLIKHNYLIFNYLSPEMKNNLNICEAKNQAAKNDVKLLATSLAKAIKNIIGAGDPVMKKINTDHNVVELFNDDIKVLNLIKFYIKATKSNNTFISLLMEKDIQLGLIEYFLGEELYKKLSNEDNIFTLDGKLTDLVKNALDHSLNNYSENENKQTIDSNYFRNILDVTMSCKVSIR